MQSFISFSYLESLQNCVLHRFAAATKNLDCNYSHVIIGSILLCVVCQLYCITSTELFELQLMEAKCGYATDTNLLAIGYAPVGLLA